MATRNDDDGSEDVADFLERIRELGDQRVREDEERARKLEEEILQGRKERQARRAERARSISPTKDSPLDSSFSSIAPLPDSPTPKSNRTERMDSNSEKRSSQLSGTQASSSMHEPTKPNPPPSSAGLARSGTLSWQQRPGSRESPTVRSRPPSNLPTESPMRSSRDTPETSSPSPKESTRSQAASMLEGKDPAWFRQTADRGKGSAAYRRNEAPSETSPTSVQLHGLGKGSVAEGMAAPFVNPRGSRSPSPVLESGSTGASSSYRPTDGTSERLQSTISPLPTLSSQRFQPPSEGANTSSSRSPTMSPSQGRISPERMDRPNSPTKGLGGFVQSAMMKRSDSVSKRWSAQAAAGLTRGNSVSASRGGARSPIRNDLGRDSPVKLTSGSQPEQENPKLAEQDSHISRLGGTPPEITDNLQPVDSKENSTNVETSRSPETKRWSPSKSSWLEAAINKSELPKAKPVAPPQPSWMVEISKAKQARSEVANLSKSTIESLPQDILSAPDATSLENPTKSSEQSTVGDPTKGGPSDQRSGANPKTVAEKTKPETPPKKDFRGSLKPRPPPPSDGRNDEPEFKNVFGKLKKAETKNYKAPDELKDNITRGKAALNVTGGPRPWQKKDEFKDSILKKKQEMKAGTSFVNTGNVAPPPVAHVPEALVKRSNMAVKPQPPEAGPKPSIEKSKPPTAGHVPEAIAKRSSLTSRQQPPFAVSKPSPGASRPPVQDDAEAVASTEKLARVESSSSDTLTRTQSQTSSSSSGSKLADRFNPGLAGILARGPPGNASATSAPRKEAATEPSRDHAPEQKKSGPLTHTTKGRARGPKRRLPKGASAAANDQPKGTTTATTSPGNSAVTEPDQHTEVRSAPNSPSTTKAIGSARTTAKPRDIGTRSAPPISPLSPKKMGPSTKSTASLPSPPLPKSPPALKPKPSTSSDKLIDVSMATAHRTTPDSLGGSPRTDSPIQLKQPESSSSSLRGPQTSIHISAPMASPSTTSPSPRSVNPVSVARVAPPALFAQTQPKSPPPIDKKPASISQVQSSAPKPPSPMVVESGNQRTVPSPQSWKSNEKSQKVALDAFQSISKAFAQPPSTVAKNKLDVDTQTILRNKLTAEKIKSLKREVWEITGDGKRVSVPAQQEHILFDNGMFLCRHAFEPANGKRSTEVHLWCGKEVSPSSIEDAQLFSRNAAKEVGGKLVILEQGKEPSSFFEALGGIVITRRGSRSSAANARYMLCGRRHLGHVAFDEIEFSPKSLCSGFPCIVASTDGTKLFLWKGKASETDIVGCARLISMDLGASGNVEEIEEGMESAEFWTAFGTENPKMSAWNPSPHATWDKYSTRLFAVDVDARPKSGSSFLQWARRASTPAPEDDSGMVREISPFAQSDVLKEGIFVLDAFFELYIIVGSQAFSKLPSFHCALVFAQEYGLLAASLEDRPFIPSGKVVLGGVPEGMRRAFRSWDERKVATVREEKIIDLNDALEAFSEST